MLGFVWVGYADPEGPPGGNNLKGRGVLALVGLGMQTLKALQEVII